MLRRHNTTLIPAAQIAAQAVAAIAAAQSRICLISTTFRADDADSQSIVDALCAAGRRGVIVSVCADSYTYTEPKEFILRAPKRQPLRAFRAMKMERTLKQSGIDFHWLGSKSNIGFAGRTHSKWLVADDTVFSFGGTNFDKESFENTDYLFKLTDAALADQLFSQHLRIIKADKAGHATKNHTIHINDRSKVLIDGGMLGNSIIYRRACQLAEQAESIVLVSQYCPTGKLNRILKRKSATLYFNHWRHASWMNKLLIQFGMTLTRQTTAYQRDNYLHAKYLIYVLPDGTKVALSGSHNYMFGSVLLGTREVALETTDKTIIRQLEQFLDKYVK
ncbi:MAG: phospholipase D-like domain-containing protein [Candidatus Saccharimonas sp.]